MLPQAIAFDYPGVAGQAQNKPSQAFGVTDGANEKPFGFDFGEVWAGLGQLLAHEVFGQWTEPDLHDFGFLTTETKGIHLQSLFPGFAAGRVGDLHLPYPVDFEGLDGAAGYLVGFE